MKNQKEDKSEKKGTKKKADKGANKLGAAQAASRAPETNLTIVKSELANGVFFTAIRSFV
ncbi:hypothetical protein [Oryza sativa Japonica Group]|uniref:Uncharacterized protein n=1 Tax=Oryza sativa subsp. japonica TaxID=39947 RepID=Q656Q8_ORYSJ|nr:hypothetical protein [Oryza sativa Japonica Group]BAD45209.1 hypothetical protein [Oryza sativa Japonica Group]